MEKKTWLLTVACPLALIGGCLLTGPGHDDRSVAWMGWHLEVVQKQLAGLADELHRYHKAHGRYPTNDEGLGVLDFDWRFALEFHARDPEPGYLRVPGDRFWDHYDPKRQKKRLESFAAILSLTQPERFKADFSPWQFHPDDGPLCEVSIACSEEGNTYLADGDVIFSPWQLPYGYENRRGLDASLFDGSPVDDGDDRYALKVDEGIYVYSVAGQLWADEYDSDYFHYHKWPWVGGAMILIALVLGFFAWRKIAGRLLAALVLGGMALLGFFGQPISWTTCYIMAELFYRRDEQAVARQRELLEDFRDRGVITPATWARAISAIDRGPIRILDAKDHPSEFGS